MGGSLGRTEATGYGVIYILREALKDLGIKPEDTTVGFQGFGNVARYAGSLYNSLGGTVVSVSCWDNGAKQSFTIRKKDGLDIAMLAGITNSYGTIDREKALAAGCEVLPGDEWISQEVDILIPSALENQITPANIDKISKKVKVIVEGANGPTTPDADELIKERGIFLIPDFLANAGGVTCSYFEQVQSNNNFFWPKDEVLERLDTQLTAAYRALYDLAQKKKMYMRDAAYVIAINRVVQAVKMRGWVR
jgi:glutamate dehydrogenase (NAD(P)+)